MEGAAVCLQQPLLPRAVLCGAVRCCSSEVPTAGGEHRTTGDGCCVNSGIRAFVFNGL